MGLAKDCEDYFGTKDLYSVLSIEKQATPSELKKGYKKASLLIHPDRVAADAKELATRKFQVLSKVFFILSDVDKRAAYDETGLIDEENNFSSDDTPEFWDQYWRNLFPKLTKEDIVNFFSSYKGSDEEITDLKDCYVKYEGDMNLIADAFLGYEADNEDRVTNMLMDLINKGEVPSFPKFVKESKAKKAARMRRHKSEAKEAAKAVEELDLAKAISKRSQERESEFHSMIQSLEAKYCKEPKKMKKKR